VSDDDEPIKHASGSTGRHADRNAADDISTWSPSLDPNWKPPPPEPWEVALDAARAGREMSARVEGVVEGKSPQAIEEDLQPKGVPPQPHEVALQTAQEMRDLSFDTTWNELDETAAKQQEIAATPVDAVNTGLVSENQGLGSVDESGFGDGALLPDPPQMTFAETDPEITSFVDEPAPIAEEPADPWLDGE